jgi:Family of unknown function (DUF6152)
LEENFLMKSMNRVVLAALIVVIALFMVHPILAHHSSAGFSQDVKEISGTVKEFQFRNPHSWIQVNVQDANGKITEWSVEWGSPNQLGRDGIRPSTFSPGMNVTIKIRPMMNGSPVGGFVGAKMPDGKTLGKWDSGE